MPPPRRPDSCTCQVIVSGIGGHKDPAAGCVLQPTSTTPELVAVAVALAVAVAVAVAVIDGGQARGDLDD